MATSLDEQIVALREHHHRRIALLEKKVRTLMEYRATPATKKELRDYVAWSMNQRIKARRSKKNAETVDTS
jgi:low affinity Fe/Cu permease